MKINGFVLVTVTNLLISCFGGIIETEMPGTPKIENSRILGYDWSSGEYVVKYTFYNSWDRTDLPYLEFIVYDDDLDIYEITITLYNDAYPNGRDLNIPPLNQYSNPQTCRYRIEMTQDEMRRQDNNWYLKFFVTDHNGKRSKVHTSDLFTVVYS